MIANIFGSGDIHTQETIETEFEMVYQSSRYRVGQSLAVW